MKPSHAFRNALSGGVSLAIAALVLAPPLALRAGQEQEKFKEGGHERAQEEPRPEAAPRAQQAPARAQESGGARVQGSAPVRTQDQAPARGQESSGARVQGTTPVRTQDQAPARGQESSGARVQGSMPAQSQDQAPARAQGAAPAPARTQQVQQAPVRNPGPGGSQERAQQPGGSQEPAAAARAQGGSPARNQEPAAAARAQGGSPARNQEPAAAARAQGGSPAWNPEPAPAARAQGAAPRPATGQAARPAPGPAPASQYLSRPVSGPGVTVGRTQDGSQVYRGPSGAVREVRTPAGAVVHYAPNGMRHVEVARPDGRVVFANGNGHEGFIQRPYVVHNQTFVQRTYVERGVVSVRVYRPCVYAGVTYHVYMPVHYYRPAYYAYAYRPWGAPVYYRWGWGARPWYGFYGGYYQPYPYYASPLFWLTDFMVAATFEAAYQANLDNAVSAPPPSASYQSDGMTPEVKQAIADEVHRQIEQERAEQQQAANPDYQPEPVGPPPALFSDNVSRIFLVPASTVAYDHQGREVHLSEGDVLQLNGPPAPGSTYADVEILASAHRVLPRGSTVSVSLFDLQDMQNRMRANIDQGLGDLQAHQGQDGLPPLPASDLGATPAPYAAAVQPDPGAPAELSQVAQQNVGSDQLLDQGNGQSRTVALGMTESQVLGILGNPRTVANAGARKIEVFQDLKVTFTNGRVTDFQ